MKLIILLLLLVSCSKDKCDADKANLLDKIRIGNTINDSGLKNLFQGVTPKKYKSSNDEYIFSQDQTSTVPYGYCYFKAVAVDQNGNITNIVDQNGNSTNL